MDKAKKQRQQQALGSEQNAPSTYERPRRNPARAYPRQGALRDIHTDVKGLRGRY